MNEVERAWELGIRCVVLFPKVNELLKSEDASECFNENGLIPRAIRRLKKELPDMTVMTDVALDPYSCDGHDGIVSSQGVVLNDETIEFLCRQAVVQAQAGADLIETNTFNANSISQADYGMEHMVYDLNLHSAKIAKTISNRFTDSQPSKPRFVCGAIGPTNQTASMSPDVSDPGYRNVDFDRLVDAYKEKA